MDLTSGHLFVKLGLFSIPMALTTVLQLLYTTIDLISVHFWGGGESSASAISANQALINLIVIAFSAMSLGANVAIGNALGARQRERGQKILHTSLLFALILGILIGILGYFTSRFFLELMKTEPIYLENATTYMHVYFLGLPLFMVYNYTAQIHRAIGDSQTPFLILFASGLVNLLFDFLFVYFGHMDVMGVALATVISEGISAILGLVSLGVHKNAFVCLRLKELRITPAALWEIVRLGLPAGLQGFFFALPNTFIQAALYQVAQNNIDIENGAIAANTINNYCYAFVEAISSATMAIVAQNYGAKKKENILRAWRYGFIWVSIFSALYAVLILTAYHPLLSLFVDHDNDLAISAGRQRLWLIGLTYILDGYMDIYGSIMKGVRHPMVPMLVTMLTCTVFRILAIETLILRVDFFSTVLWLYSVYPISWVLADIADSIATPIILRKEFRKMDAGMTALDDSDPA